MVQRELSQRAHLPQIPGIVPAIYLAETLIDLFPVARVTSAIAEQPQAFVRCSASSGVKMAENAVIYFELRVL